MQKHEVGTGMPDELEYESHLLDPEEAIRSLKGTYEELVVRKAWALYEEGLKYDEHLTEQAMRAGASADTR